MKIRVRQKHKQIAVLGNKQNAVITTQNIFTSRNIKIKNGEFNERISLAGCVIEITIKIDQSAHNDSYMDFLPTKKNRKIKIPISWTHCV